MNFLCYSGWNGIGNAVSALLHTPETCSVLVLFDRRYDQLSSASDNDMHITCSGKALCLETDSLNGNCVNQRVGIQLEELCSMVSVLTELLFVCS